ncbi:hypothetical protein STEG23_005369, partial [Scotinomys teguina]
MPSTGRLWAYGSCEYHIGRMRLWTGFQLQEPGEKVSHIPTMPSILKLPGPALVRSAAGPRAPHLSVIVSSSLSQHLHGMTATSGVSKAKYHDSVR